MLGLAVLFGVAVWVAITIGAVFLGAKALKIWWKKPYAGLLGGFLGFMLTMGGFIVYWAVEYIQIQRTITHLCETEGGITVYVTPEEWRKQIGEEEWDVLVAYNSSQRQRFKKHHKIIDNREYYSTEKFNRRITLYQSSENLSGYIGRFRYIAVDADTNNKLIEATFISAGTGAWLAGGSYKQWLKYISSCARSTNENFYELIRLYSNNKAGETQ